MSSTPGPEKSAAAENVPSDKQPKPALQPHAYVVWRGAALLLILMVAYLWWTRNFGEGLAGIPVVAALVAAFSFAFGFMGEGEQKWLRKKFLHFLVSGRFLAPVSMVMIVLLFSTAPVVVVSQGEELGVKLSPADNSAATEASHASKDNPARFHLWSTPFGRPVMLEVKGYAPKIIEVAAPLGVTISPERDLTLPVALLVRPGPDAMRELASGGSFRLLRSENGSWKEIASAKPQQQKSLLIAPTSMIVPRELMADWLLELQAQKGLSENARSALLIKWKNPLLVKLAADARELSPRQNLKAEIYAASTGAVPRGPLVASGCIELPEAPGRIVDLPLDNCGGTP